MRGLSDRPVSPERDQELLRQTAQAAAAGDLDKAIGLAESALVGGLQHPLFFKLRAVRRERQGRLIEAIADLRAALADAPDDFAARNALGLQLARTARAREGLAELDRAIALNPGFAPAHRNRGWTLEALGEPPAARAAYERALELEPGDAKALAALAWLAARRADWPEARIRAEAALRIAPEPAARVAAALADLRAGEAAAAEHGVRALLAEPGLAPDERSTAHWLLGEVLDARDRPDEAIAAYRDANATVGAFHGALAQGRESALAFARRLGARFDGAPPRSWPKGPADHGVATSAKGLAFLLGFPRSGTTLLGQVLGAHPEVVTLDERETLAAPAGPYLVQPDGLDRLAAAGAAELDPWRRAYWAEAFEAAPDLTGKLLVDKLPMNTLALPLIARLFPDSRVMLMVRDPRDVVLSCFKQPFAPNRTNLEFLSLESAARFYDAVMRLALDLERALDLRMQRVRYEDLVGDFEGETRRLCRFLGLKPAAGLADFASAARAGEIATPSAAQVARGLYGEGVGQWRRYGPALATVMPILEPWIDRFGYDQA